MTLKTRLTTKTTHRIPQYNVVHIKTWLAVICSVEGLSQLPALLLPCPIKVVSGIDCPGCGFQRSLIALMQGQWQESYRLYPPTVPLLILLLYIMIKNRYDFDKQHVSTKILALLCGWFVLGVYLWKLWHGSYP